MRALKVVGIAVVAFIVLMLIFWGIDTFAGQGAASQTGQTLGDFVNIFVVIAVIAIIVGYFKKKKK